MFVTGWDDKAADRCLDLALESHYAIYDGGTAENPVFSLVVTKRRGEEGRDTDVVLGEDGVVVVSSSIMTEDTKMTKTEVGDAAGETKKEDADDDTRPAPPKKSQMDGLDRATKEETFVDVWNPKAVNPLIASVQ